MHASIFYAGLRGEEQSQTILDELHKRMGVNFANIVKEAPPLIVNENMAKLLMTTWGGSTPVTGYSLYRKFQEIRNELRTNYDSLPKDLNRELLKSYKLGWRRPCKLCSRTFHGPGAVRVP
mmetsp:Transcript_5005/g.12118  ORF Transcript_5005/g.12118 Transcript_5005/m.12118 type:complete len:121 (-) Transcript_5005:502-864(-)